MKRFQIEQDQLAGYPTLGKILYLEHKTQLLVEHFTLSIKPNVG